MPYFKNPYLSKVRQQAVNLVYQGWSTRKVARYFGLGSGTVSKWLKRGCCYGLRPIPTLSSRPHSHPRALSEKMVDAIVKMRLKHHRCAEVIHQELLNQGLSVSLSVKRTLERQGLIRKRSPWKRWHFTLPKPEVQRPGDLVQIDTVHLGLANLSRVYVYALIDVFTRWAHAKVSLRINTHSSLRFVKEALKISSFTFLCYSQTIVQSSLVGLLNK
jgi:transposase